MRKFILAITILAMTTASAFAMCAHNDSKWVASVAFKYDVVLSKSYEIKPGKKACFKDKGGKLTYLLMSHDQTENGIDTFYRAEVNNVDPHGGAHVRMKNGELYLCSVHKNGSEHTCNKFKAEKYH